MIKRWFIPLIFIVTVIVTSLFKAPFFVVYAIDIEQNSGGIPDFYLYNELLAIANEGLETPYLKLETNALSTKEEIVITNSQIQSLQGLELLNLSALKRLYLTNNKIQTITSQMLSGLTSIELLDLGDNELTQIDVSNLTTLNTLLLSGNNLSAIDLSSIIGTITSENGYVDLKNNNFNSLSNITLPSEDSTPIVVDLNNNYLVNQNANEFTNTHILNLMFQGAKSGEVKLEIEKLYVYEAQDYLNFNVKIYDTLDNLVYEIFENESLELVPNEYTLRYFDAGVELFNEGTKLPKEFTPILFTVKPTTPVIELKVENEVVSSQEIYRAPVQIIFFSYNENANIYYSINNGNWLQDSTLLLEQNGTYNIKVKSVMNNVESNLYSATFNINIGWQTALSVFKGVASLILIIVLFMVGYIYYTKKQ